MSIRDAQRRINSALAVSPRYGGEPVTFDDDTSEDAVNARVQVKSHGQGRDQVTEGLAIFREEDLGDDLSKLKTSESITHNGVRYMIDAIRPPASGLVKVGITRTDSEFSTTSALDA